MMERETESRGSPRRPRRRSSELGELTSVPIASRLKEPKSEFQLALQGANRAIDGWSRYWVMRT
ncbi:MAG TPA: hypothetical protein VJY33_17880 [Isosphaeraceae bacterium]|nr:hypothetical protein [Isosphaeraceae bacterium]